MPIRPENRARYPANWPEIRLRILARAMHRCEYEGCTAVHRALGYWRDGKWVPLPRALRDAGVDGPMVIACADGSEIKVIRIVLTIAHLDHTPENCDPANLRAWCQRHHLAYDAQHHAETAYRTRRAAARTADMFAAAVALSEPQQVRQAGQGCGVDVNEGHGPNSSARL